MLVIIQARTSSKRFPGKVLKDLAGKPLLQWTIERLANCKSVSQCIVATSIEETDNPIAKLCEESGWNYYRGDLDNVADRFVSICQTYKLEYFIRISGDSPLIDPLLVDHAVKLYNCIPCFGQIQRQISYH